MIAKAAEVSQLAALWAGLWQPPERLPLSQWARRNFRLSSDYSATSGGFEPWGWQVEPLDAFTDPDVNMIVLMTSTQMLKTIFMQLALSHIICETPGPALFSQPTEDDVSTFSKERLAPMIRDNPGLSARLADAKSRDSANTISSKVFPGGSVSLVGANSPGNFARRTIQYIFCDEVDKYKPTAEGDQIVLGMQRTMQYGSRAKIVLACSPTVERGRINKYFEATDKRRPWVPCPYCNEFQVLKWAQVKWKDRDPRKAKYHCEFCDHPWTESERWRAADLAVWRPENPDVKARGYWISHLYSRKKRIAGDDPITCLAAAFLQAKESPEKLQVFINTSLAEIWRESGERPAWERLRQRAEDYAFNDDAVIPMGASVLTCSVDFQKEWLQVELKAWGRGRQNWSMGVWKVELFDAGGAPLHTSAPAYQAWLQAFLQREWLHESGARLPLTAMALDSGNNPEPVYKFAQGKARPQFTSEGVRVSVARTVVVIKGDNTVKQHERMIVKFSDEDAARKRGGIRVFHVGGGYAKTQFYNDLRLTVGEDGVFPAGYSHFPRYEDWVFKSFCSEERVEHDNGIPTWQKVYARNEALDNHVYNAAVAHLIGVPLFTDAHWTLMEKRFGIDAARTGQKKNDQIPTARPAARPVRFRQQG